MTLSRSVPPMRTANDLLDLEYIDTEGLGTAHIEQQQFESVGMVLGTETLALIHL